ncbi:MAG TPA: cytochrome c3 family protein, partial [Candidatus Methanoperedens sp.]|nr:cytochrome c3 family protein [Candidatus Methanoperedens sp.]
MKKLFGIALLAVAALFVADPGWAAITGTPHEVPTLAAQGACSACHVPHKAAGKRLWPSNMSTGTLEADRGEVGALCGYCHDPGYGQIDDAKTAYPFKDLKTLTHGLD